MSTTPAAATATTSHHPACTGLPPARTRRVSMGRISGSLAVRSVRPRTPNGETRRVRTSHEARATTTLVANAANTRERIAPWTSRLPYLHPPPPHPSPAPPHLPPPPPFLLLFPS